MGDIATRAGTASFQASMEGLRYDPDQGIDAKLSCTSSGHVWLSTLPEDDAIELVKRQGIGTPDEYGPNAPTSMTAVMKAVRQARKQGYAIACETYAYGLNAMSTVIVPPGKQGAVGVLSMSGPSVRLTETKMREWAPDLLDGAADVARSAAALPLFDRYYAPARSAE